MTTSDDRAADSAEGDTTDPVPDGATAEYDGAPSSPPTAERSRRLTRPMKYTLWGVGALVALGIVVAIWLFTTGGAPGTTSSSPESSPRSSPGATPGPLPGATATAGSEVQPPSPTETAGAGLPPLPKPTPLVAPPLPPSASASGELVDGFPESIIGPAPDSDVLSSSIATERDTMQVTLVARSDASADDIRAYYEQKWADLGLAASGAADGTIAYSDSFTSLSLAFSDSSGTGTIYTVFGVFRTS